MKKSSINHNYELNNFDLIKGIMISNVYCSVSCTDNMYF